MKYVATIAVAAALAYAIAQLVIHALAAITAAIQGAA